MALRSLYQKLHPVQSKTEYKACPFWPTVTRKQCLLTAQPNQGNAQKNKAKQKTDKRLSSESLSGSSHQQISFQVVCKTGFSLKNTAISFCNVIQ